MDWELIRNCGEKYYAEPIYCECGQALKWGD